jgi:hypothetical protein
MIKSRRTRWVEYVARMAAIKNRPTYKTSVGRPELKRQLGKAERRIILKGNLNKYGVSI